MDKPKTGLAVTFVLGAIALTGHFDVRVARLLLIAAWIVIYFASRAQPMLRRVVFRGTSACVLIVLALVFKPDVIPSDTGILSAKTSTIFSPAADSEIKAVEVGTTGTKIILTDPRGQLLFSFLSEAQFKVERVAGKSKVSALVKDSSGKITVQLRRNEWQVAPAPGTWDRNYTDDALEVIDPQGNVVLQVRVLPDRVRLQGEWWGAPEGAQYKGIRVVQVPDPKDNYTASIVFLPADLTKPEIQPMFEYPSAIHLGELRR